MRDFVGIVVGAGAARRFGGAPKQFRTLGGRSVLERSVHAIAAVAGVEGVVVVLARDELAGPHAAAARSWPGVLAVAAGGATRLESVAAGLAAAPPTRHVLVHDAARPLASRALVAAVVAATRAHGAAIPALRIPDTVKEVHEEGWIARTLERDRLRLAQTPQGARADWLAAALARASHEGGATDEAEALERAGHRVAAVEGEAENRKITTPADLEAVRRSLERGPCALRVGTGFDIHRFGDEHRPLVLGGVTFPGEIGLAGHSDADVVLHAAMDALLGAAGEGDIGALFPPGDERFRNADSRGLARQVAALLAERGFDVVNLDLTVLAERPRIGPRRAALREAIAAAFGIEVDRVGLKATTLEGLGALGRGAGVACQAVALLDRGERVE